MEEFEARLVAAYQSWHASRGRTPEVFFALYDEDIELHSILEASLMDEMHGPFLGKNAALAYFTAIAESWEMVDARTDGFVARDDKVVWIGHATWRSEEHTSELQSPCNLVCRLLLEKKKTKE